MFPRRRETTFPFIRLFYYLPPAPLGGSLWILHTTLHNCAGSTAARLLEQKPRGADAFLMYVQRASSYNRPEERSRRTVETLLLNEKIHCLYLSKDHSSSVTLRNS